MRRLLAWVVAAELAVAGFGVASVSNGLRAASGTDSAARIGSRADAESQSTRSFEGSREGRGAGAGAATASPKDSGEGDSDGEQISFRPPIDFATGAIPSAEAFNAASGDQLIPLTATHAYLSDSVAVGDFDGDGNDDVAQTNVIAGSVSVFLGDGRSGFSSPDIHAVGVHPHHIVTGDLDRDGDLDLAVANSGSDDVAILSGDGSGGFLPAWYVAVPDPRNIAIGEFNDDEIPDLAVATHSPALLCPAKCDTASVGGVAVLMGVEAANGTATFDLSQFVRPVRDGDDRPTGANFVVVGDFDGSGRDDFAIGVGTEKNTSGLNPDDKLTGDEVLIYLNRNAASGDRFNTTPSQPAIRVGATPDAGVVADLNGDEHLDLAVLAHASGEITSLLGDAKGHFTRTATNVTVGGVPRSLAAGDFNDDDIVDVATAHFGQSTVAVLEGNGDGTFHPAIDYWAGDAPTSVAVGHFDENRRLDIVTGRLKTDKLSLLLNDSPQRGDGVVVKRDIPFGAPPGPFASHQTLDVYLPPTGTRSFAGGAKRYPIILFFHGGAEVGDKTMVSYLMRSLAREGMVAVSANYQLGPRATDAGKIADGVQAFRWVRDNLGGEEYGGDPGNLFVSSHSSGGRAPFALAFDPAYAEDRESIRGLVVFGGFPIEDASGNPPPIVMITGDQGFEIVQTPQAVKDEAAYREQGADAEHFLIRNRDHFTIYSNVVLPGDEGRAHVMRFLRKHVR